ARLTTAINRVTHAPRLLVDARHDAHVSPGRAQSIDDVIESLANGGCADQRDNDLACIHDESHLLIANHGSRTRGKRTPRARAKRYSCALLERRCGRSTIMSDATADNTSTRDDISIVAVIGAGTMGHGIAQVCALAG